MAVIDPAVVDAPALSVYDVNVSREVVGAALQERLGDLVNVTCCYTPNDRCTDPASEPELARFTAGR